MLGNLISLGVFLQEVNVVSLSEFSFIDFDVGLINFVFGNWNLLKDNIMKVIFGIQKNYQ